MFQLKCPTSISDMERVPGDTPDNIDTVVDTTEGHGDTDLCEISDLDHIPGLFSPFLYQIPN